MTLNRIGVDLGLLKAKMEGSLSVGRMDSVISPRPESAPSMYEYSFFLENINRNGFSSPSKGPPQ